MVRKYGGRVRFVSENWGTSSLAARFGLKRYPVVFVDEVLVAKPKDFGGWDHQGGRYAPWRDPANHEKFKKDLSRMIDLALRDSKELARKYQVRPDEDIEIASLPAFSMKDIRGQAIESSNLSGQVVIVEFWATWCPPCRSTLDWLGEVKRRYGDRVTVLAMAIESEDAEVRQLTGSLAPAVRVAMGSAELVKAFGDINSVPTMFVFDREGKTASVFYGAPKDLHQSVGRLIDSLLK
ncbi:MAG: TlpA family protein disulfide reductase [Blastocatellia bacterium]|nr:TlpA family protein disulfide reductase [Blastocatellia bacterium]